MSGTTICVMLAARMMSGTLVHVPTARTLTTPWIFMRDLVKLSNRMLAVSLVKVALVTVLSMLVFKITVGVATVTGLNILFAS